MDLQPARGTLDLLPPQGSRMRALYDRAAALARLYGYRYVETPGFEATELFARTSGETSDVVTKEMYTFEDRKGRSLTLRPEGTAPVMRAYLAKRQEQPSPFKAYYLTRMYRYARPQEGRYREHRQFGIEVFGTEDPGADAEVIAVGDAFLRGLGLERIELQLNSIGDEVCRPAYREELIAFLREHRDRLTDEHRDRFEDNPLRVLDCKDDACRAVAKEAPKIIDRLCDPCRAHFEGVQAGLKDAGLSWVIEPTLVRGLDYYTPDGVRVREPRPLAAAGDALRRRPLRRAGRGARRAARPRCRVRHGAGAGPDGDRARGTRRRPRSRGSRCSWSASATPAASGRMISSGSSARPASPRTRRSRTGRSRRS